MSTLTNMSGRVLGFNGGERRGGVTLIPTIARVVSAANDEALRKDVTFGAYLRAGEIQDRFGTFADLLDETTIERATPFVEEAQPVKVKAPRAPALKVPTPSTAIARVDEVDRTPISLATEGAPLESLAGIDANEAISLVNACDSFDVLRTWFKAGATAPVIDAINARGILLKSIATVGVPHAFESS